MKKSYFFITILVFALQVFTGHLNAQCVTPTGLAATGITPNGAYLYANSTTTSPAQYNIRYHSSNVTTWTVLEHVTLPYQLINLGCNTTYVWQAQQICVSPAGITSVSDWSAVATFTTALCTSPAPAPCIPPTGLLSSNINQTSAYLHLNATTANSLLYNIRYHGPGTATWTVVEHVTLPYQLGNLACGTTYEWQAQLICTNSATGTTSSDWSADSSFATLACTTTPCNAPTGLSATNVSQTGAYLYLSPTSSNAGTFNIRYHGANATTWTYVEHVTLPYQLVNLACGTTYEWQAQLICTNPITGAPISTVSPWSVGGTFTTSACPVTPCNPPTGLSATNVSQTGAYLHLTPTSSSAGTFNIRYHGANGTTWTTLEHVTLPYQLGNLACGTTYEWQAQLICPSTAGTTAVTVSSWSTGGTFTTLPCTVIPCNAPTGLSATNVSQTGAYLYLSTTSSNTGTFNIRYHAGLSLTWTTIEHVTLPYQLGNLACGTVYEWQAQLICSNTIGTTISSPWSAGGTFTTLPCTVTPCNAPTGLSTTNVSQNGAYLYLTLTSSNTGTFNIRYHGTNTTTWTYVEHVTLPYQLGNLACGTTYEWQAQLICPATAGTTAITVSPWSTAGTFTTLPCTTPTCNPPTGLSATNVTQTGASLYLSPTSSNIGTFNIRYHGPNANWTTVEHVTLPYQLGNLACGTTYEWQAQLICSNSATGATVSPWSTAGVFTTLACTTTLCNSPTGLSATNVSQNGAYLYLSPTSGNTGMFNIRYHGPNATWTTIEHVTLPYQLGNLACGNTYEWQAQLICSTIAGTTLTTVSPWSTGGTFTTLACTTTPCNPPIGLSATNVSQTGAYLYLTPTSSNTGIFNIRYHGANSTWTTIEHVTLPYQLGSLACGTTYEWQAQLICTNSAAAPTITVSPWSAGGAFTILPCITPTCGTPTGLHATNINPTSAILHWNAIPGAVAYIVRYKKANNTILEFTTVTTASNAITLNTLTAGSHYIWQVQAVCSTTIGGLSTFSAIAAFGTPSVTIFPNPASGFVNVSFWLEKNSTTTILLRDSHGQVVYSLVTSGQVGANNVVINTTGLSVGLYFLSIQTNAYSTTKKLVIGH